MEIKCVIETWNDEWRFEIEDKESGDIVTSGLRSSYTACAAECLEFVAENRMPEENTNPSPAVTEEGQVVTE